MCVVVHVTASHVCVELPATPTVRGTVAANDLLLGELHRRLRATGGESCTQCHALQVSEVHERVDLRHDLFVSNRARSCRCKVHFKVEIGNAVIKDFRVVVLITRESEQSLRP